MSTDFACKYLKNPSLVSIHALYRSCFFSQLCISHIFTFLLKCAVNFTILTFLKGEGGMLRSILIYHLKDALGIIVKMYGPHRNVS